MQLIITILLGPILLIQGWYVRRNIIRLDEPAGDRHGVEGNGTPLSLLIIGDSAAAGVGVEHQKDALSGQLVNALSSRFNVNWRLLAKSGETTASFTQMLAEDNPTEVDAVVISLGVNDVTSRVSESTFISQTTALVDLIRQQYKPQTIIFSALPPMGKFPGLPQPLRWFMGMRSTRIDRALEEVSASLSCCYYSGDYPDDINYIAIDGFHPGGPVYKEWGQGVAALIKQLNAKET